MVYGEPAIAASINLRARVKAKLSDRTVVKPFSSPYVMHAIRLMRNLTKFNAEIEISSSIPPSSGLASSAAVTVATLGSLNELLGIGLRKDEIAKMAYEVELRVQGIASRMDTMICTLGGVRMIPSGEPVRCSFPHIIVGNSGILSSTRDQVRKVAALVRKHPSARYIMRLIGKIVRRAKEELKAGEMISVGKLMDFNHTLLSMLGVTSEVDMLVDAARRAGAFGAKVTGAGGGGCVIAIGNAEKVCEEMRKIGVTPIRVKVDEEGLRYE